MFSPFVWWGFYNPTLAITFAISGSTPSAMSSLTLIFLISLSAFSILLFASTISASSLIPVMSYSYYLSSLK